jgi:spermidine/putrescine transport system ATP-binding protein
LSSSFLQISNVKKTFTTPEGGEVHALDDVSLDINSGEFFVMLGPSGCGKTTLLRSIAGLEYPDSGTITLDGQRIDDLPAYDRPVNTVFQSYALFPHMTVGENIAFGLEMEKIEKSEITRRVSDALDQVKLSGLENRKPTQLSGGQQQRVALARALAKKPKVLLLDEPLSALDLKLRRGMQIELKRLQQDTGITFVFVTHDQEEAMSMGDRIAVFKDGKIIQLDTPREIYRRPVNSFVADFIGETNLLDGTADNLGVKVAGGGFIARELIAPDCQVPAAGQVTIAIRPEDFEISTTTGAISGIVRDVIFTGDSVRVHVDLGATEVVATLPSYGERVPDRGATISLNPLPQSARTVAS